MIQARTIADLTGGSSSRGTVRIGKIKLLAQRGTTKVSGTLDASAPSGGKGGVIDTSGEKVAVANDALITTKSSTGEHGTWIIDPDGFTVAASGGDIDGSTLSLMLLYGNVSISSTSGGGSGGNIDVNDFVSWGSTTLTFNATKAINVNTTLNGGVGSGLVLNAGTDVNVNAPSSLQVSSLMATAGGNVNFNAPQLWSNASAWTFSGANINVNDKVGWSAGTLTLNAASFINLNAVMTASNAASLVVSYNSNIDTTMVNGVAAPSYGTPLGGFTPLYDRATETYLGHIDFVNNTAANALTINGNKYTLITSVSQLDALGGGDATIAQTAIRPPNEISGYYALAVNLDASGVIYNNSLFSLSSGVIEGLGHNIDHFTIGTTTAPAYAARGLVAWNGGVIRDLSLTNLAMYEHFGSPAGGLVGTNAVTGQIFNVSASGTLTITNDTNTSVASIGGLVGMDYGLIYGGHAHVDIDVTNALTVGGFVGETFSDPNAAATTGIVLNSESSGNITATFSNSIFLQPGQGAVGGFIGRMVQGGSIYNSSASGNIAVNNLTPSSTVQGIGGFVGRAQKSANGAAVSIGNSLATGSITIGAGNVNRIGGFGGQLLNVNVFDSSSFGSVPSVTGPVSVVGSFAGQVGSNSSGPLTLTNNTYGGSGSAYGLNSGYSGSGVTSTTATGPSSTQGAPPSNAAQTAADARTQAASFTQAATGQRRAAAAASARAAMRLAQTRAAASAAGNVVANNSQAASTPPNAAAATTAGRRAIQAYAGPALDDLVSGEEFAQTQLPAARSRARHASAAPTRRSAHPAAGAGYGARIHSIEADGHHFDLGNGGRDDAPARKAR